MALTDNCHLFGAVHEDGLNLVLHHLRRKRPSMFNFATQLFVRRPDLLCVPIDADRDVLLRSNPLFELQPLLPVPGSDGQFGMDFCLQLKEARLDFHPGNAVQLPPELNAPLREQRVALQATVCAGLGCPTSDVLKKLEASVPHSRDHDHKIEPVPADKIHCFCLAVFGIFRIEVEGSPGFQRIRIRLEGLEMVDVKPDGLESTLECFLQVMLRLGLLPKLRFELETLVFRLLDLVTLRLSLVPASPAVPHNPAIEHDQLRIFVRVEVA